MSSLLQKKLKEKGASVGQVVEKKKSTLVELSAPSAIRGAVDAYIAADQKKADAEAEMKANAEVIRDYTLQNVIKTKSIDNVMVPADTGAVNVSFKDQFTMPKTNEGVDALKTFLKSKKLKNEVKVGSKVSINFDKMTEDEQEKLIDFLTSALTDERRAQIVIEELVVKVDKLKEAIPEVCTSLQDVSEFKEATGWYSPTVAVRKAKDE